MKIRFGPVLALALGLGLTGCASGGGGTGGGLASVGGTGGALGAGESPRDTDNTRGAEQAIEAAEGSMEDAEARMHYEAALTSAEAAIAEDARNPLAHRLAAIASLGLEDFSSAGAHFDHAVELRPLYEFDLVGVRERAWIDRYQAATPYVQSGDYESAVQYFEDANAIYSARPEAMITLGQIYAQLREHDKALAYMDQAEAFAASETMTEMQIADSATAGAWQEQVDEIPLLRAQVLADAGRFEEAEALFRQLTAASPTDITLKRSLAQILTDTGDEAGATEIYEEMLTMDDATTEDMFAIGVGFYRLNDYSRAVGAFSSAVQVSRNDRDALEMWARSLQLDSAFTEVPPVAERWAELDPNSGFAYIVLAQAANVNGDAATTQRAMAAVQGLQVHVNDLQLRRFGTGGAQVNGSVINKTLAAGASVSLRFTFYSADGTPLGTVTESATVGAVDMAELFSVQFDSTERVEGYGYELTVN